MSTVKVRLCNFGTLHALSPRPAEDFMQTKSATIERAPRVVDPWQLPTHKRGTVGNEASPTGPKNPSHGGKVHRPGIVPSMPWMW